MDYKLTIKLIKSSAERIAGRINSDHPGMAYLHPNGYFYVVMLKHEHYEDCKQYVKDHCRIR